MPFVIQESSLEAEERIEIKNKLRIKIRNE